MGAWVSTHWWLVVGTVGICGLGFFAYVLITHKRVDVALQTVAALAALLIPRPATHVTNQINLTTTNNFMPNIYVTAPPSPPNFGG